MLYTFDSNYTVYLTLFFSQKMNSDHQPQMTVWSSYGAIFFKMKCIFSTFKLLYFCHCISFSHKHIIHQVQCTVQHA